MSEVKPLAPTPIGDTGIVYAQGMRAGDWLFFTGHEASDYECGIAASVLGKPGCRSGERRAIGARETFCSRVWRN